jgi:hypothetical protein
MRNREYQRFLTQFHQPMFRNVDIDSIPTPLEAAAYYDAAVRLVIAGHVSRDPDASGPGFSAVMRRNIKDVPETIGKALAAVLGAGAGVVRPIVQEAVDVMLALFGDALKSVGKSSIAPLLIIGAAIWIWLEYKKEK